MNIRFASPLFFALLFASGTVLAAEGKVTILSPAEGAKVSKNQDVKVSYEAVLGPNGDHLHLNIDGEFADIVRPVKGEVNAGTLSPGKHRICLAVNTKAHVPTGVEGCVDVISQ
jgi:hypothetical protein